MLCLIAPAPEQAGRGRFDFSDGTTPGELLIVPGPPLRCTSGRWNDACGCRRSFAGVETRGATTTAIVVERDREEVLRAVRASAERAWKGDPDAVAAELEDLEFLVEQLARFDVGTRLWIRVHGPDDEVVLYREVDPTPAAPGERRFSDSRRPPGWARRRG